MWLWNSAIKPAITTLGHWINDAAHWVSGKLKPIVDFLTKVKHALDWAWTHVVSRILAALDIAHLILSGLGSLGVKWAQRADAIVFQIRTAIYTLWKSLATRVNDVISVMSLFVDPRGTLRRSPWLWSTWAYAHQTLGLLALFGARLTRPGVGLKGPGTQQLEALHTFRSSPIAGDANMKLALADFRDLTSRVGAGGAG